MHQREPAYNEIGVVVGKRERVQVALVELRCRHVRACALELGPARVTVARRDRTSLHTFAEVVGGIEESPHLA